MDPMGFPSRRVAAACVLTGLVLVAGCTTPFTENETQILIENELRSSQQVSVYQAAERGEGGLRFHATTGAGDRRLVGIRELQNGSDYSRVTLDGTERSENVTTVANGNTTQFVDWGGERFVFVIQTHREEFLGVHVVECDRNIGLVFSATRESFASTARCAKSAH